MKTRKPEHTHPNPPPAGTAELQSLGLTEIEALVYIALLRSPGATGYRVGQTIGKPTPNVYKALRALLEKGAAMADESDTKTRWRAVPIEELVAISRARLERNAESAVARLRPLEAQGEAEDQVVRLGHIDQAVERALRMLDRAESIVLLDALPALLEPIADALVRAAARGVRVVIKTYRRESLEGVEMVMAPDADHVLAVWPGAQLSLAVDGRELLMVMTDRARQVLHRALWSDSVFLACLFHNFVAAEIDLGWYEQAHIRDGRDVPGGVPGIHLTHGGVPGFDRLTDILNPEGDR